ncbi:DUF4185 domain-containing protein [Brachybacterium sp. EE-P12]|uniref:DUF4185 domain-containing protein n=1 Tax=Brachybacterium sp. EE-P12 TaxID=2306299 RepID=UPI000F0750DA|nr:DUF4185 domain-containing protein [Brachybacterium sp. EE-P12]
MPTARSEDSDDCAPDDDTALSRTGFLRGGAAALAAGTVMTAGAASARPAPGKGGHEARRGVDPNPDYRRPRVTRLRTVTGPGITTRFRMDATDLGAPAVTPDGRILVVFGDTFEEAAVGGGWWRAPVGLYANPRRRLETGLSWTSAVGGETAEELVEYAHDSDPVSTILPGDVLTVGGTMYLWVMVNHGFGNVASTEIWTSNDSGESWERTAEMFPGDHLDGLAQQCTWALHPSDGHVYLLTTGFQRDKEAILQRVPQEKILDPAAYETYGATGEGEEQRWDWGLPPTPVLGGQVGEMCLRIVEDRWVLTWFNAGLYRVDVLLAGSPEEIRSPAFSETLLWGGNWGQEDDERVAQLYGPYVLPGSTLEDLHLLCSQWNTAEGWPYHVQQYRVEGLRTAAGLS